MSVDDWARREAFDKAPSTITPVEAAAWNWGYFEGVTQAFSALLSDEAVEAAARALGGLEPGEDWPTNIELGGHALLGTRDDEFKADMHEQARAALQAAVDAVTKEARND